MRRFYKIVQRAFRNFFLVLGAMFFLQVVIGIGFYLYIYTLIPSSKEIKGCLVTKMYKVQLCPGSKDYAPLAGVSAYLKKSVILSEDSAFYQHNGFDWKALQYSFEVNMSRGRYVRGGSTITQQLAKNLYLTKEKTLWRKFLEALITVRIEKYLTKKEILERYLNVVEFGPKIYGIKKAAQHYFQKNPKDLNLLESIYLTFLLPSPQKYSKSFDKGYLTQFGKKRMRHLIQLMYRTHQITEEAYNKALSDLEFFPKEPIIIEPMEEEEETDVAEDEELERTLDERIKESSEPSDSESPESE